MRGMRQVWSPSVALAAGLLVALVLGGRGLALEREAERLRGRLALERAAWERLAQKPLAPTAENAAASRAHVGQLEALFEQIRFQLASKGSRPMSHDEAIDSDALYFALLEYVEQQRTACADAGIVVNENLRFGFAAILQERQVEGPKAVLWQLHRQKQVLETVLQVLRRGEPSAILEVARSMPGELGNLADPARAEVFPMPPELSQVIPGMVGAMGFRLRFRGQTATLRTLIRGLAEAGQPIVVRSIGIRPAAREKQGAAGSEAALLFGPLKPEPDENPDQSDFALIGANESEMTVLLEVLDLGRTTLEEPTGHAS